MTSYAMAPHQANDVTLGELARSVDELKTDFRELAGYMRAHVDALPQAYMPRTEIDARLQPVEAGVRATVAALTQQVDGIIRLLLNQLDSTAGT